MWPGDPDKVLRLRSVVLVDEALDGVAEAADGAECAAIEAPERQPGEEAFDGVERCSAHRLDADRRGEVLIVFTVRDRMTILNNR